MQRSLETIVCSRWAPLLSLFLLLAVTEIVYLHAEQQAINGFGFGLDDAWIHATLARNLVEGRGWGLNPGEPVSASTAPLYTLLLAGWYALFREVIWGAKILGMLGLAVATFLLLKAVERLTGSRFVAWMSGMLCVTSPPFLWSSLNGMEIGIFLISPSAALYFWSRKQYRWMVVALALGVWLRPEAVILLGLGWLAVPARQKLVTAALAAIIIAPYIALNCALSSYPFPVTVRTKSATGAGHFGAVVLHETWWLLTAFHFWPIFVFVPLGLITFWRNAWWAAAFPFLFFLAEWGSARTVNAFSRYLYPALPYLFVTSALGVWWLLQRKPVWKGVVTLAVVITLAGAATIAVRRASAHAASVENVTHMQVLVGKIIPEVTAPSDSVGTSDIGAIGYFAGRHVIDLAGVAGPLRPLDENLRRFRPHLLAIFDKWFPGRTSSETFLNQYVLLGGISLSHNAVCGDSVMSLYARADRFRQIDSLIGDAIERHLNYP